MIAGEGRVALVTGGAGAFGAAVCARLAGNGRQVAVADLGPVDVPVKVAGWDRFFPFVDTAPALWDQVIDVNYRGVLNTTHAVMSSMIAFPASDDAAYVTGETVSVSGGLTMA